MRKIIFAILILLFIPLVYAVNPGHMCNALVDTNNIFTCSNSASIGVKGVGSSTSASYGIWGEGRTAGVYGISSSGYGVYGSSSSGRGVYGFSTYGRGVYGFSTSGYGLYGESSTGIGIYTPNNIIALGKIGIGTTAPSKMLEVAGNFKANSIYLGERPRSQWDCDDGYEPTRINQNLNRCVNTYHPQEDAIDVSTTDISWTDSDEACESYCRSHTLDKTCIEGACPVDASLGCTTTSCTWYTHDIIEPIPPSPRKCQCYTTTFGCSTSTKIAYSILCVPKQ